MGKSRLRRFCLCAAGALPHARSAWAEPPGSPVRALLASERALPAREEPTTVVGPSLALRREPPGWQSRAPAADLSPPSRSTRGHRALDRLLLLRRQGDRRPAMVE